MWTRINVRVIRNFELDNVSNGKRRESLGELYELCDNSCHNCSSYAEFTVSRSLVREQMGLLYWPQQTSVRTVPHQSARGKHDRLVANRHHPGPLFELDINF